MENTNPEQPEKRQKTEDKPKPVEETKVEKP